MKLIYYIFSFESFVFLESSIHHVCGVLWKIEWKWQIWRICSWFGLGAFKNLGIQFYLETCWWWSGRYLYNISIDFIFNLISSMEVKHLLEIGMECLVRLMMTLLTLWLLIYQSPHQEQVPLPSPSPGSTLAYLFSTFSPDLRHLHLLLSWILSLWMYAFKFLLLRY